MADIIPDPEAPAPAEAPPAPKGDWRQMKPNPMWPEEVRALIRGYVAAKGEKLEPCAACGSKKRGRWTMLCPFKAYGMGQFAIKELGTYPARTLVCSEHMLRPTDEIMEAL